MRTAILSGILFLSGIGSLIFETLWLRISGLTLGNSVWSAAVILSSFMAGLGLGNALASASRVRRWHPLRLYAVLEGMVALLGCAIVWVLPVLGTWLRPVFQTLWNHQPTLMALRVFLSFAVLVLPATAMGLTLPVLMEDRTLRKTDFGRAIGLLYGFNTLGAVAGALVGEMWLVAAVGVRGTALSAGSCNCIAAIIALAVAKFDGAAAPRARLAFRPRLHAVHAIPWRLLLVSFATGGILLCLEVVWFRFLRLYVASYTLAFSVMLAVVLAAIALGSIISGVLQGRFKRLNDLLPLLLLLAAIATLLCYILFPGPAMEGRKGSFNSDAWSEIALLSLALMFPVAFLSGMIFPCVVTRVQSRMGDRMNSTGITTLSNTIGAMAGPLLASFVLLPAIGFQWSLLACAVAYGLVAVIASQRHDWSIRRPAGIAAMALSAALALIIIFFPRHRDEIHFAHASAPYQPEGMEHLVTRVEGTSDTLQLRRRDLFGQPYYYRLVTNAISMSATIPRSQRYMRLFAYLPLALRPESEDVLLICYGCGNTADAFSREARLKHIDIVDISKEVLALAPAYTGLFCSNPLRDPRVTTFVQDGRFFLQASPKQYDIITGEPPPPKVAGAVNLYTEEFFSQMYGRLKEGGIATYWLPMNQLRIDEAKAILRAFHNAFANCSVWASSDEQWILMGIKGSGHSVTEEQVRQLWSAQSTGADLKRIGIEVPQQMASFFLFDGEEITEMTRATAPLTDSYPKRLSEARPDEQAVRHFTAPYMRPENALPRFLRSEINRTIWPQPLTKSLESYFIVREARYLSGIIGSNGLAELDLYLRRSRLRTPVLEVLHSDEFRVALAENAAGNSQAPSVDTIPDLFAGALARRDFASAIQLLETQCTLGPCGSNDLFLLAYIYCLNGETAKAEELVAGNAALIKKDWFADWLWEKLRADFGFHPPK